MIDQQQFTSHRASPQAPLDHDEVIREILAEALGPRTNAPRVEAIRARCDRTSVLDELQVSGLCFGAACDAVTLSLATLTRDFVVCAAGSATRHSRAQWRSGCTAGAVAVIGPNAACFECDWHRGFGVLESKMPSRKVSA